MTQSDITTILVEEATEADVRKMIRALIRKGLKGDLAAIHQFFDLLGDAINPDNYESE